ncbi:MAG TPA: hypothetical protein PLP23_03230 [Panacibacter sp.]|nr:hypothetical protein [Panacibacter sp.]
MKKNFCLQITVAIVFLAVSFGCSKEATTPSAVAGTQQGSQYNHVNANDASSATTIFYTACGLRIEVFNPNANLQYSFEYHNYNSTPYIPFGVLRYGAISFIVPDKFKFVVAGDIITPTGKFHTWWIKRTDGKYLTAANGVLSYQTAIKGSSSQIFLIGSLGINRYELVNLSSCLVGTINYDIDFGGYRFFTSPSTGPYLGDYQLGLITY